MKNHAIESDLEDFLPSGAVPAPILPGTGFLPKQRLNLINLVDKLNIYLSVKAAPITYLANNGDFQIPSLAEAIAPIEISKKTEVVVYAGSQDLNIHLDNNPDLDLLIVGGGKSANITYPFKVLLATSGINTAHWVYPDGTEEVGTCSLDVSKLGSIVRITRYFGNTDRQTTTVWNTDNYYRIEILAGEFLSDQGSKLSNVVTLRHLEPSMYDLSGILDNCELFLDPNWAKLKETDYINQHPLHTVSNPPFIKFSSTTPLSGIRVATKPKAIVKASAVTKFLTLDPTTLHKDLDLTIIGSSLGEPNYCVIRNTFYKGGPNVQFLLPDGKFTTDLSTLDIAKKGRVINITANCDSITPYYIVNIITDNPYSGINFSELNMNYSGYLTLNTGISRRYPSRRITLNEIYFTVAVPSATLLDANNVTIVKSLEAELCLNGVPVLGVGLNPFTGPNQFLSNRVQLNTVVLPTDYLTLNLITVVPGSSDLHAIITYK